MTESKTTPLGTVLFKWWFDYDEGEANFQDLEPAVQAYVDDVVAAKVLEGDQLISSEIIAHARLRTSLRSLVDGWRRDTAEWHVHERHEQLADDLDALLKGDVDE